MTKKLVWQAIGWESIDTYKDEPVYNTLFPTKSIADEYRAKMYDKASFSFSMSRDIDEHGMPVKYLAKQ